MIESNIKHRSYSSRFDDGTKRFVIIDPSSCVFPFATRRDLCRLRTPSASYLCLYSHIELIIFAFVGRGTNLHVLFLICASYSSVIDGFQFGSRRAFWCVVGRREAEEVNRVKIFLGFTIPACPLVRHLSCWLRNDSMRSRGRSSVWLSSLCLGWCRWTNIVVHGGKNGWVDEDRFE